MGVWGLTSLVEDNPCIFRDCSFRGGRLVIDGSNLLGLLYFQSGLDQNHGGEYAAFEELVENFITALRTCSVSPFMVLDGGLDVSGKKFQMLAERGEELTHRAHRAAVEGSQENIRPLLANLVFIQTLVRLKVPMVVYDETDQEIAALAKEWDCPVLSSNSDFYIFDIPAGMLPLSHFRWRALKQRDSQSFIPCKNYRTSNFCTFFGIQKQLLPTFAALAGNYFVKLKIPDRRQFSPAHVKKRHYLWGLLSWLKRFHVPEKAVEAILEQVNAEQQQETQDRLYRGIREYQLPSSCLKMFFIDGIPPPVPEAAGVVPDWIQSCLVRGEMNPDVLDVLRLQRRRLQVCVGSSELPSAHQTSEPLRQVMYGLLVPRRQVVEMDRVGLNLEEISVQPVVTAAIKKLALDSLPETEHSQRLQVLLEALNVNKASLSRLPSELQLPVAVTCYWWQNARPTPDVQLLKALLLGLSVGASQSPEAALLFERMDFALSHSMAHNVIQWQSCLKECISLNQLLCHPLPPPHISRLYQGALVHHLIQQMMSRKLKNFLKKDLSCVLEYKNMLAIVRRFDSWQPRRRRAFHQGHQPPVKETVSDMWQLYDEEEEAAAVRALKDVDLGHMVSLKARHTAKDKRKWNRNPVMVCKGERRGKDLI